MKERRRREKVEWRDLEKAGEKERDGAQAEKAEGVAQAFAPLSTKTPAWTSTVTLIRP